MERSIVFIVALILISLSTLTCTSQIVPIEPYEIWITMDQEFIKGNTTKAIVITNNKDENMNFTGYIENPSPASKRQNRTNITDLSWIDIQPKWYNTSPGDKAYFYIYLNIPETEENLNQSWEAWATFRLGSSGLFNWEHSIRIYIDTPKNISAIKNQTQNGNIDQLDNNQNQIIDQNIIIFLIIITVIITTIVIFLYKKKKT